MVPLPRPRHPAPSANLMPFVLMPLIGLFAGLVFAQVAGPERNHALVLARTVALSAGFGLLLLGPIAAFFLAIAPDWSLAYFIDSRRLPNLVFMLWVLAVSASAPLATWVASTGAFLRRRRLLLQLAGTVALLATAVVAATLSRTSALASHAQFHGGFGVRSLAGSPLGYGLVWLFAMLIGGAAWTARAVSGLSRTNRRA